MIGTLQLWLLFKFAMLKAGEGTYELPGYTSATLPRSSGQ
jgi:hypothetical protein